jgi:hypothetical protein
MTLWTMKKSAHVSKDQTEMKSWFWLCYYFGAVISPADARDSRPPRKMNECRLGSKSLCS